MSAREMRANDGDDLRPLRIQLCVQKWVCVTVVCVAAVVAGLVWKSNIPESEQAKEIRRCEQHVEELLQTRQGTPEEQQMQEWQGTLDEPSTPAQKWQEAVQIVSVLVGNVRANMKSLKDTAEKASNQIDDWTGTGQQPVDSGTTEKYIATVANVATELEAANLDFASWCQVRLRMFKFDMKFLEMKLRAPKVNIHLPNKLLNNTMVKGLGDLEEMKPQFESMQARLNELPTISKDMGFETCEQRGSLKTWEKGFTEQLATAHDLKWKSALLLAHVSKDSTHFKDVHDHLYISDSVEDVALFKKQVFPQIDELLSLLDEQKTRPSSP
jgi:hypothetical protein